MGMRRAAGNAAATEMRRAAADDGIVKTAYNAGVADAKTLRGFSRDEYARRSAAAQRQMTRAQLDAIVLTTDADINYFSGFRTLFWQSPSRPWFLIVPARGAPSAVIPEIGAAAMAKTWIDDVQCWPSPRPRDEGVSLLAATLKKICRRRGKFGMMLGAGSAVRMPLADWLKLQDALRPIQIADCAPLVQKLRMQKSAAETAKIRRVAGIAARAFAALPSFAAADMTAREIARDLQVRMIENGADEVPYLSSAAGDGGYDDIIAAPDSAPLKSGQVLMIDAGARLDGYFCDFNRNYAVGRADARSRRAHTTLTRALKAGFAAVRPGVSASAIWRAMRAELPAAGPGRMGHGVGLQLTEPPSLSANDSTALKENMILALEPSLVVAPGKIMVCEENIVVREDGAGWLHRRAGARLPSLQ